MAQIPRRIDDRFVVDREVGSGGMGTVYLARDERSGAPVALKVLAERNDGDAARFEREVATLAALDHPGIVRYVAHGAMPDGKPYLVMEWVEGESLEQRLARRGLSVRESIQLLRAIAGALAEAHRHGVVHRDLKPANILLPDGEIKRARLIDFGIARRAAELNTLTRTGDIVGSPGYLAPEQARGMGELSPATDVFALGCVLYECLTGRSAFGAQHTTAMLAKILLTDPDPVVEVCPEAPLAIESLIDRMLAKDIEARPPDAAHLLDELEALGTQLPDESRRPVQTPAMLTEISSSNPAMETAAAPHTLVFVAPADETPDVAALDSAATHADARLEVLADGAIVAIVHPRGDAAAQATRAARLALALRELVSSDRAITLASTALDALGGAIDRGTQVLERHALRAMFSGVNDPGSGAIRLDDGTASRLPSSFVVDTDADGPYLLTERDS